MKRNIVVLSGLLITLVTLSLFIADDPFGKEKTTELAEGELVSLAEVKSPTTEVSLGGVGVMLADTKIPTTESHISSHLSKAQRALLEFDDVFDRYRRGDDTLTDEELGTAEARAVDLIRDSPEARAFFAKRLAEAFKNGDILPMYALERAFRSSVEGLVPLMDIYRKEIESGGELDYYAIQGLNQLQDYMTDAERVRYLDAAISQFGKYDNLDQYLPSMLFMANTVANPLNRVPPMYSDTVTRLLQSRQAGARTEKEQFFSAQSLYRVLPRPQATQLAHQLLISQPTPGNVQAVLEAVRAGQLPLDGAIRSELELSVRRLQLGPEQLAIAEQVLGVRLNAPQPGGSG